MSRKPRTGRPPASNPRQRHSAWRPAVLTAVLALVGLLAAAWWFAGRHSDLARRTVLAPAPGQNLLLITIDTLRADALGAYGGRAETPNLDALASTGARFTFAHAHAVMTLPSHASILTGRLPFEHGVRDNAGFRLGDSPPTLAEAARARGMATAAFVGAFPLDRQFGLARGFDVYDDVGGRQVAQGELRLSERRAEEVVAPAVEWIATQHGGWFAWIHVFDPHAPYAPPPPFDRQYADHPYAGEVAYVDHALKPLLDAARAAPNGTTVVVTSDHGEGLGEHGELTHGTFAYETTLRVPLIVAQLHGPSGDAAPVERFAGDPKIRRSEGLWVYLKNPMGFFGSSDLRISARSAYVDTVATSTRDTLRGRPGAVIDAPARHIDIVPTVAALLDLEVPAGLPGRSLVDATRGGEAIQTYFEAMTPMLTRGWAPLRGVIAGGHKYIELPIEEVYDLRADPREQRNLAASEGDRLAELAGALDRMHAALPGHRTADSPEVRARLESLGYLSGTAARKTRYTEEDDPKRLIELDRLMLEGLEAHGAGRHPEAIAAYRRVIDRRPDMNVAYRRLATIHWDAGQPRDAVATLREAIARNGPDLEVDVRLGTYLAESGAAGEAIGILERVTAADPRHGEALNALGIAYAQAGRPGDALGAFRRALDVDPRDVLALENLGAAHLQRGDPPAAHDAFTRALAADPRSSRAHAGLGMVAAQAGQRDIAITHWREAVALDASNFDALFNLATALLDAGRAAEARPYVERFVRTAPRAFYGEDIERLRRFVH
jgi:arylsulfatase A-like enzyme/Tfp pilus assembly protein PilF